VPEPDPIRILHVAQPTLTGLAIAVASLVDFQRSQGIDARIAAPPEGLLVQLATERSIPFVPWNSVRSPGPSVFREARTLNRIIREFDPDVVHLASSKAGLVGRLAIRGRRPTIFSPHGWSFFVTGPTQRLSLRWERAAARWTHQFHVACAEEAQAGIDRGILGDYVWGLNSVDTELFAPADEDEQRQTRARLGVAEAPTVVCVGRLCFQKGQKPLLESWRLVVELEPTARLLLIGDGEDEAELRAMDCPNVEFIGNRRDVRDWFVAADLVVQPSRYEALSLSVLEALSCERSVVAFDALGMRTAIGEVGGAIVPIDDRDALAREILRRLQDSELRDREGRAGRARMIANFNATTVLGGATQHTLDLLATIRTPPPSEEAS
jgi:glycosyltransferase involved in cell wall biosynthesis